MEHLQKFLFFWERLSRKDFRYIVNRCKKSSKMGRSKSTVERNAKSKKKSYLEQAQRSIRFLEIRIRSLPLCETIFLITQAISAIISIILFVCY